MWMGDRAVEQLLEWAWGHRLSSVVFGPKGCGKTVFLRRVVSRLRELGFVFYLHPLDGMFAADVDDVDEEVLLQLVEEVLRDERWGGLALVVFDLVRVRGESR